MTLRTLAIADMSALSPEIGVTVTIKRHGIPLRTVTGHYSPRTEIATDYTMERTIQRASVTFFDPAQVADLSVTTDTLSIPEIGERKLHGQPKVNDLGWTTWELASL